MNLFIQRKEESSLLVWLAKYFLLGVTALFFLGILVISFVYFNNGYLPFELTFIEHLLLIFITFLGGLFFSFLIIYFRSKLSSLIWLLGIAFLLRILWILFFPTEPEQDFLKMYQASVRFADGDYGFMNDMRYFIVSPYQLGFVLYEGLVIKLLGPSVFILRFINVCLSTATVFLTYKVGQQVASKKVAILAGWFVALYVPNIVLTSVLTNQIVALFIFLWAIYLFLLGNHWYPLVGLLLFIGNLTRPLASVLLIAFILYGLFFKLPKEKKKYLYLLLLTTIPLVFSVSGKITDSLLQQNKITDISISTVNPYWKLALGLNLSSEGHWNVEDYKAVNHFDKQEERDKAAKALIGERTKSLSDLAKLMGKKFKRMWNDFDSSISWATNFKEQFSFWRTLLFIIQKAQYYVLIAGAFFYVLKPVNKKNALYLLLLIIFGYALIHQLVEIQTRYRYFVFPFIAIVSAGFWVNFSPLIKRESGRNERSSTIKT